MNKDVTQVTPEYVVQPNAISQSTYECGTNARKLIAMGMSLLPMNPKNNNDYSVSFTMNEFIMALKLTDGSRQRELIKAAVKECARNVVTVQDDEKSYRLIPWFKNISADWESSTFDLTFNPDLGRLIVELKGKAKLDLIDMGKLQSKYAIRFYELAMSYAGFAGKNGNKENCWYFEREVGELRLMFGIAESKYKQVARFRIDVVDNPIQELNTADLGFKIEIEYIRKGRKLVGFRFWCMYEKKGERSVTPPAESVTEKENEKLKKLYPEEWEKFYQEELQQKQLFPCSPEWWDMTCQNKAFDRLRKMKGIKK
jgi:plasmid replication initiation protein